MLRKLTSCADMMSSKPKVIPSHNVNSPSWFPVNSRRPPGVQLKHIIGVEFFARVTWAKYVTYALDGLGDETVEIGMPMRRKYAEWGCK